jgi:hypothetical protein
LLVIVDPVTSSALAAAFVGEPGLASELVHICRRESHCRLVGAHAQDAWAGRLMQRKALRVGWLDPTCRHHRGAPERYSTRGAHGLSAAYSLRYVGGCLPPEVLDIPMVSAIVAARRAKGQCRAHGACTTASRHRLWVGARRYDRRTRVSPGPAPVAP